ncbi:hypothetical protein Taro_010238 [Colocasia esculenta]|uniref:Uncharacterized protein n=1 Tax=Colocasia esculenta TaxID=4460 RepID=A0A843U733_COLES|nr:hypothetical protein [Colocasia esculenta]
MAQLWPGKAAAGRWHEAAAGLGQIWLRWTAGSSDGAGGWIWCWAGDAGGGVRRWSPCVQSVRWPWRVRWCAAGSDEQMCRWCGMLCDGDAEVAWCAEVARPWRSWAGFVRRAGLLCAKHGRCWSGALLCWRSGCAEADDPGGRREEADAEAMRPIKGPKVQGHRGSESRNFF